VLLALLPALIAALYSARLDWQTERAEAFEDGRRLVNLAASEQRRFVEQSRQLLFALSTIPALRDPSSATCGALLADVLRHQEHYLNLAIATADGRVLCSALPSPRTLTVSDRRYFREALRTREFSVGEYQIGRITGRPSVNFGYPLLDRRGLVHSVLVAALDLGWMNKLAEAVALPAGSTLTVLDSQGIVLARSPDAALWVGKVVGDSSLYQAVRHDQGLGTLQGRGLDNVERLYAFAPLSNAGPGRDVYVAVGIPTSTAFSGARAHFVASLVILCVTAVIGLAVTLFASEALVLRHVRRLMSAVRRLGSGDLTARANLTWPGGEIGHLAEAFDQMAEGLARRQAELERAEASEREQRTTAERLYEASTRRLDHLHALRAIDVAIASSLDLSMTLHVVLEQVTTQLSADAAAILILNPKGLLLEFAAARGFKTPALRHTRLRLGEGHAGRVALDRQIVQIHDLAASDHTFGHAYHLREEAFVAYAGAPLIAKGHVKGVLEVFHRTQVERSAEWVEFLETLAGQAAIAIDSVQLFEDLQRSNIDLSLAYDQTLEGWSRALDLRDKETEGHSQRVAEMTVRLGRAAAMTEDELMHVRRGALLHDIGKVGIPDGILLKPAALTDDEWAIMRRHPVYAFDLLSPIAYLRAATDIPYCHHERWDGTGYPRGLKGEQIPLAARIFAIVDVWDGLCSDRPYRGRWPEEKVLNHLRAEAGRQFDPRLVEVFLNLTPPGTHAVLAAQTGGARR
jgi:response regulator RpfG family c-di-GMP phosphodiesterase/HAMP domain-containing protein